MKQRSVQWLCVAAVVCALASPGYGQALGTHKVVDPSAAQQQAEEQAASAQKRSLAESILDREELQSGREFDPLFRAQVKQTLSALPAATLQAQASQPGLGTNNLGDSGADLVYTPVAPCRIVDTRVAGGPLAAGSTRSFKVTGDTTAQGGGNCGIPFGPATAAVVNFVSVDFAAAGDLRVAPFGTPMPLASVLNYAVPGRGLNLANGVAVALCNPAATTCASDITVQADSAATHLVADVQGYFRSVRKEQVKSAHVVARTSNSVGIAGSCTSYTGASLTVTAPVAGTVVVRANVNVLLNHLAGTESYVAVLIGASPSDCAIDGSAAYGYSEFAQQPAAAAAGQYHVWLHPSREFAVGAGTYTFSVNGLAGGGSGHIFWWGALEATFIPN